MKLAKLAYYIIDHQPQEDISYPLQEAILDLNLLVPEECRDGLFYAVLLELKAQVRSETKKREEYRIYKIQFLILSLF
jgi:hypothetical protein